ncbi:MAG: hypothetical protein KGN02_09910 [bacterium]|nr:hypothetical protein [bacterium]
MWYTFDLVLTQTGLTAPQLSDDASADIPEAICPFIELDIELDMDEEPIAPLEAIGIADAAVVAAAVVVAPDDALVDLFPPPHAASAAIRNAARIGL